MEKVKGRASGIGENLFLNYLAHLKRHETFMKRFETIMEHL